MIKIVIILYTFLLSTTSFASSLYSVDDARSIVQQSLGSETAMCVVSIDEAESSVIDRETKPGLVWGTNEVEITKDVKNIQIICDGKPLLIGFIDQLEYEQIGNMYVNYITLFSDILYAEGLVSTGCRFVGGAICVFTQQKMTTKKIEQSKININ